MILLAVAVIRRRKRGFDVKLFLEQVFLHSPPGVIRDEFVAQIDQFHPPIGRLQGRVTNPRSRDDNSSVSSSLFLFLRRRLNRRRRVIATTKAKQHPRIDDDVGSHLECVLR